MKDVNIDKGSINAGVSDLAGQKIYVQLAPDAPSLEKLIEVQSSLPIPRSGRMMPASELHMTVIHFGKADEVYKNLHQATAVDRDTYNTNLAKLVTDFESLITDTQFTLHPLSFAGLGKNGHTLVIHYDASPELDRLHHASLKYLKEFFAACGITNVDSYMELDPNFTFARTLTPHITLYKGYDGPLPHIALTDVTMGLMKVVY